MLIKSAEIMSGYAMFAIATLLMDPLVITTGRKTQSQAGHIKEPTDFILPISKKGTVKDRR
jgi:hypothetical protein